MNANPPSPGDTVDGEIERLVDELTSTTEHLALCRMAGHMDALKKAEKKLSAARSSLLKFVSDRMLTNADVLAFKAFFEAGIDWTPEFQTLREKLRSRLRSNDESH